MQIRIKSSMSAAIVAWLFTATAAQAQSPVELAQAEYEVGHYAAALAAYEQASDQGDTDAAARAGEMLLFGRAIYAGHVSRDLKRAERHLRRAAEAGVPTSAYLLKRIGASRT